MQKPKDFSDKSLAALLSEKKKIKRNQIINSILIGFLAGVIIYGIAKNGFGFLYTFIPLILIYGIVKSSQKLGQNSELIQNEIHKRKSNHPT